MWTKSHTEVTPAASTRALLGGTLAAGSHFTKAGTRAVINTSPEPFSNWVASFGEDVLVGTLVYLALAHPVLALLLVALLLAFSIWLLPRLWRFIRALIERIGRWTSGSLEQGESARGDRRDV